MTERETPLTELSTGLHIVVFGTGLLSTWRAGTGAYWRGLLRALHERGHRITFVERHDPERDAWRDVPMPLWGRVGSLASERPDEIAAWMVDTDVVVVGDPRPALVAAVSTHRPRDATALLFDLGPEPLLEPLLTDRSHPLGGRIGAFDAVVTAAADPAALAAWSRVGARRALSLPPGLDPDVHKPSGPAEAFLADVAFMGARHPGREARFDDLLVGAAKARPHATFAVAGAGWDERDLPANVLVVGHLGRDEHNAFFASARLVLSLPVPGGTSIGGCVPVGLMEAASAGACVAADPMPGLERLFVPGVEVLLTPGVADLVALIDGADPERVAAVARAARARALVEHTWARRAADLEAVLLDEAPASGAGSRVA